MRILQFLPTVVLAQLLTTTAWGQFSIAIDPGSYTGNYIVDGVVRTGMQTVSLTQGTHLLDNGANIAGQGWGSYFAFSVGNTGTITSITNPFTNSPSASASGVGTVTLSFTTAPILVQPLSYSGVYMISPFGFNSFTGAQTFHLIRELTYSLDDGASIAGNGSGSYFIFTVGSAGTITAITNPFTNAPSGAATASGSTLIFQNMSIRIMPPGNYSGTYTVGTQPTLALSGSRDIVVIPSLETWLRPSCDPVQYFTPDAGHISPSTLTFVCSGQSYEFTLGTATTFASFAAKVKIEPGPQVHEDSFETKAAFRLGAASDGIDPLKEDVTLKLMHGASSFAATIPAGSFTRDGNGSFKFDGTINGVGLEVKIIPHKGNRFEFKAEGEHANLAGLVKPVMFELTIGDDSGSTTEVAAFNQNEPDTDESEGNR